MRYAGTFVKGSCEYGIEFPWSECRDGSSGFPTDKNALASSRCVPRETAARVRQNGLTHIVSAKACKRV